MDIVRFDEYMETIFVDNHTKIGNDWANPFSRAEILTENNRKLKPQYEMESEWHKSLQEVLVHIEQEGGIKEGAFYEHMFAINSIARHITHLTYHGDLENAWLPDDRAGVLATLEQSARFPEDKIYRNQNINSTRSGWEGTLFDREFTPHLSHFRMYHQGHRDTLNVKTVDVNDLIKGIENFCLDFSKDNYTVDIQLPYSAKEFEGYVGRFNEEFGNTIRIRSVNDECHSVMVEFPENPTDLGRKFEQYGQELGINVELNFGPRMPYLSGELDERDINLFAGPQLEIDGSEIRYDATEHAKCSTAFFPHLNLEMTLPLIKKYVQEKIK
jgi:hypothetical protein